MTPKILGWPEEFRRSLGFRMKEQKRTSFETLLRMIRKNQCRLVMPVGLHKNLVLRKKVRMNCQRSQSSRAMSLPEIQIRLVQLKEFHTNLVLVTKHQKRSRRSFRMMMPGWIHRSFEHQMGMKLGLVGHR